MERVYVEDVETSIDVGTVDVRVLACRRVDVVLTLQERHVVRIRMGEQVWSTFSKHESETHHRQQHQTPRPHCVCGVVAVAQTVAMPRFKASFKPTSPPAVARW